MFFSCDTLRKTAIHRTDSSRNFSIVVISNQSTLNVKSITISKKFLFCLSIILIISFSGFARGAIAILLHIKQCTTLKKEQNKNRKLTSDFELLDNYLSDILTNDHPKCEIPQIGVLPYCQVSKASLFVFDKSMIVDFKNFIKQIDRSSITLMANQKGKNTPFDNNQSFLCPTSGMISSFFGIRADPVFEGTEKHCGIDIAGKMWSPVIGTENGKITIAGWNNKYGNMVMITHKTGIQTIYAHMQKIVVKVDDQINAGQLIGYLGSTGKSTGAHLHYEVRVNNKAVNPIPFLLPRAEVSD